MQIHQIMVDNTVFFKLEIQTMMEKVTNLVDGGLSGIVIKKQKIQRNLYTNNES